MAMKRFTVLRGISRAGKIVGVDSVATPPWGSFHEWTVGWKGIYACHSNFCVVHENIFFKHVMNYDKE